MSLSATMIGATGLVGSRLLELLRRDDRFGRVEVFTRRASGQPHPKVTEHIIDFNAPDGWAERVQGEVCFSALGTTLRKAGTQEAQYEVDYVYQYRFAEAAARNGGRAYVLVSSMGASARSPFFYARMKGELEEDVQKLAFERVRILRPGVLAGERQEERPLEGLATVALGGLGRVPGLGSLRPVPAHLVAAAMIQAALDPAAGARVYSSSEVFRLAEAGSRP